eukprot:m.27475 g.27475  ORF g.27475 m.27475 type:complete len:199 (-) comp4417_c0_seq1:71-667(-)
MAAAASVGASEPSHALQHLQMPEVEFLAEEQEVEIIPNFEAEQFRFIAGDVGPFRPQRPIAVPLWLARTLRQRHKCKISPPDWLSKERLTQFLDAENSSEVFAEIPDYFQEMAAVLVECAAADIPDCEEVRALLADLYERRYQKIRRGLARAQDSEAIKMNNITRMEISSIRPFFVESMNAFFVLNDALDQAYEGAPE